MGECMITRRGGGIKMEVADMISNNRNEVPKGNFLLCDGSIQTSTQYPVLAERLQSYVPQTFEDVTLNSADIVYFPKIGKYVSASLADTKNITIKTSSDCKTWSTIQTINIAQNIIHLNIRCDPALDEIGILVASSPYSGSFSSRFYYSSNAISWTLACEYRAADRYFWKDSVSYLSGVMTADASYGEIVFTKTRADHRNISSMYTSYRRQYCSSKKSKYKSTTTDYTAKGVYKDDIYIVISSETRYFDGVFYENNMLIAASRSAGVGETMAYLSYSTDDINFKEAKYPQGLGGLVNSIKHFQGKWFVLTITGKILSGESLETLTLFHQFGGSNWSFLTGGGETLLVANFSSGSDNTGHGFACMNIDKTRFTLPKIEIPNNQTYIKSK